MNRLLPLFAVLVVIFLIGCNGESTPSKSGALYPSFEKAIFDQTNAARTSAGLSPLVWDDKLAEIAREHSEDMAKNNFFSHTNLQSESPKDRGLRHNYTVVGENIGKISPTLMSGDKYEYNSSDGMAKLMMQFWMAGQHKYNLLNPSFTSMGVGIAYDGNEYLITQTFK